MSPDRVRLRHMLESARAAVADLEGVSRAQLQASPPVARSVVRSLEIIGEAAAQVSEEGRLALPDLPWGDMVGMRNRLVHAYWQVDLDIVWDTVTTDLPPLVARLCALLEEGAP